MRYLKAALRNGAALWQQPLSRVGAVTFVAANAVMILAWSLADDRIGLCRTPSCPELTTAARDATLVNGLTIDLVTVLAMVVVGMKSRAKPLHNSIGQRVGGEATPPPVPKVPSVIEPVEGKSSRLRALILAVAFGMALAGGLLWFGGLLQLSHGAASGGATWPGAPVVPSQRDSYSDLIPPSSSPDLPDNLTPVHGNPFDDIPIVAPPPTAPSGGNAAANSVATDAEQASADEIDE